jgi:flagellar protein FliS
MLYAAAIKNARQGKDAILAGDIEEANGTLLKAQDIIYELMNSLRLDVGELAANLCSLYDYMISQLIQANIHKNAVLIEHVIGLLSELKEAWEKMDQPVESNDQTHTEIAFRG